MSEQTPKVEPLRPNQVCDKALKGTAHREERKDLSIQGPLENASTYPELKPDSTIPKKEIEEEKLKQKIQTQINESLKNKKFLHQLVVEPITELNPISENDIREIVIQGLFFISRLINLK